MKTSNEMLEQIKKWEGLRLTAYLCPSGVRTIGYGHTSGTFPDTITIEQAHKYLQEDLTLFESLVNKYNQCYGYEFTQGQFDALVSFAFNCGNSNLLKLIDNGRRDKHTISEKIILYVKSNGKTLQGLVNRRKIEQQYFLKTDNVSRETLTKKPKEHMKLRIKPSYRLRTNCDLLANSIDRVSSGEDILKVLDYKNNMVKVELSDGIKWVHKDGVYIEWY